MNELKVEVRISKGVKAFLWVSRGVLAVCPDRHWNPCSLISNGAGVVSQRVNQSEPTADHTFPDVSSWKNRNCNSNHLCAIAGAVPG